MNSIHQQVWQQYLAVNRANRALEAPAAGLRVAEITRQETDAQPVKAKPPVKGRHVDVMA